MACESQTLSASTEDAQRLGPAELAGLLQRPELEVFKQDQRSRVWLGEDTRERRWVIKRFEYAPLRQRLVAIIGMHPAQREALWHRRLRAAGLPAVSVTDGGFDRRGRRWLITPYLGRTLDEWQRCRPGLSTTQRHDLTRQAGRLTGKLLALKLLYRDLKATNLVVDAAGQLHLIDAGACRGAKGTPLLATALRTLTRLHHHTQRPDPDGSSPAIHRTDRLRFYKAMLTAWPAMPDGMQHLLRHAEFD